MCFPCLHITQTSDAPMVKYIVKWTDGQMSEPPDDMEDVGKLLSQMLQKYNAVKIASKN